MSYSRILAVSPSRVATVYQNATTASRVLSGVGSDGRRHTITRRCDQGGGYVGNTWVQYTNLG